MNIYSFVVVLREIEFTQMEMLTYEKTFQKQQCFSISRKILTLSQLHAYAQIYNTNESSLFLSLLADDDE